MEDPYKDGAVKVSVLNVAPEGSSSPQGLTVECENETRSPIAVKWEKSSIILNGASVGVFLGTEKSEDLQKGPREETVPAGSRVVETVYPVDNVEAQPGAYGVQTLQVSPLGSRQVSLSICVNVAGEDRFYAVRVGMEAQAPAAPAQTSVPAPDGHMSTK